MKTEFVKVEFDNCKPANAVLSGHREIIKEYAEKDYSFSGYVPTKIGPSGKIIEIDLVFQL